VTYYRWRQEFGGLKTEEVKRLKDLELENSRLRNAVSDLTLHVAEHERAEKNCRPRVRGSFGPVLDLLLARWWTR
jgi:Transposase